MSQEIREPERFKEELADQGKWEEYKIVAAKLLVLNKEQLIKTGARV